MAALVVNLFPTIEVEVGGSVVWRRVGGRGVSRRRWGLDRDETGRGVDENTGRHLLTGLGSAFLCPPRDRPFLPRDSRAPQTDDAPACPGGWTIGRCELCEFSEHRMHRGRAYCASPRLCGLEVHSTRTRQRHGPFFPFQAPCPSASASAFASVRQQTRVPPASPRLNTAFSYFCSYFFSDMRILEM
jgi:hypothetical protein